MRSCYALQLYNDRIGDRLAIVDLYGPGELFPGAWVISRINTPREFRGQGVARRLMQQVLEDADREGVRLALDINASDGLDHDQLEAWYRRLGFKRGRYGYMVRRPRAILKELDEEETGGS